MKEKQVIEMGLVLITMDAPRMPLNDMWWLMSNASTKSAVEQ